MIVILAYHIVFSAYGFWLPNDPRGSWSTFVEAWELLLAGGIATKTGDARSKAHDQHKNQERIDAKKSLKYPPVEFDGLQALAVAAGFNNAIIEGNYTVYACSILPAHVHLVLARLERDLDTVVTHLKSKATMSLRDKNNHPFERFAVGGSPPACWSRGCWKVYLDSPETVREAIDYVEQNPLKEGKRLQKWSFVKQYG